MMRDRIPFLAQWLSRHQGFGSFQTGLILYGLAALGLAGLVQWSLGSAGGVMWWATGIVGTWRSGMIALGWLIAFVLFEAWERVSSVTSEWAYLGIPLRLSRRRSDLVGVGESRTASGKFRGRGRKPKARESLGGDEGGPSPARTSALTSGRKRPGSTLGVKLSPVAGGPVLTLQLKKTTPAAVAKLGFVLPGKEAGVTVVPYVGGVGTKVLAVVRTAVAKGNQVAPTVKAPRKPRAPKA